MSTGQGTVAPRNALHIEVSLILNSVSMGGYRCLCQARHRRNEPVTEAFAASIRGIPQISGFQVCSAGFRGVVVGRPNGKRAVCQGSNWWIWPRQST